MTETSSLAELKKRQQQKRKQQQKERSNLKRKHTEPHSEHSRPKIQTKLFQPPPAPKRTSPWPTTTTTMVSNNTSGSTITRSLFAAAPRTLCQNPFDIIDKEIRDNTEQSTEPEVVVVVGTNNLSEESDSDIELRVIGRDQDESSDSECEYDPSMYKLQMPIRDQGTDPLSSSQSTMVTVESAEPIDTTATNSPVVVVETSNVLVKPKTEEKPNKPELMFSRPPESLSMRTHVSVTMEIPLKSLEPLNDDVDFFTHTSLCPNNHSPPRNPLSNIADALIYWEAIGAKPQDSAAAATTTAASAKPPTNTTAASSSVTPTYGTASGAQIKQSLQSLYHLQKQAPLQYPFIYLVMRDFSVIFKMIPQSSIDSGNEPAVSGHRRVAVLSQSYLGLRRILRTENVDFSMPLAPKLRSWNELQNDDNKQKMHVDKYHLQSTGVDKTWRSAVLIMDEENANGLFKHLQTVSLDNAQLFSTNAFVNGTMRKSAVRFSSAVSYEDHRDPSDQGQQQVKRAKNLYKLDIKGVVLPNAWHSVLMALAELPETREKGFVVAAKERPETIHLNMLVSKQGSSVTGKRNISYDQGQFIYS